MVYANQGVSASGGALFTPALCAVLVGALLFIVSLPRVQQRIGNATILPLVILSIAAFGAMFFAAGPGATPPVPASAPSAQAAGAAVTVGQLQPSESLLGAVFWVILAAAALYIGTLPLVRKKILAYVAESAGVRVFSYSSTFIVLTSILFLGAMFYAAQAPLWETRGGDRRGGHRRSARVEIPAPLSRRPAAIGRQGANSAGAGASGWS